MGSIREIKPGKYELRFYARDANGKPLQRSRTFNGTKTAAAKALRNLEVEADRGEHDIKADNTLTVHAWMTGWLTRREQSFSTGGYDNARIAIETNIEPDRIARIPLTDLRHSDVQAWVDRMGKTLAPATVRRRAGVLSSALTDAVRREVIPVNVCAHIQYQAKSHTEFPDIGKKEIDQLLAAAPNPTARTYFQVAALTGWRRQMVVGLRWADVDFEQRRLASKRTIVKGHGGVEVKEQKQGNRFPPIPMGDALIGVLLEWRAYVDAQRAEFGLPPGADGYLFAQDLVSAQVPIYPDTANKWWGQASAHMPNATPHDLRHAMATNLLAKGVDVATVARRLNQSPKTTQAIYAHGTSLADEQAAEIAENLY